MNEQQIGRQLDRYAEARAYLQSALYAATSDGERVLINRALQTIREAEQEVPPFSTDSTEG